MFNTCDLSPYNLHIITYVLWLVSMFKHTLNQIISMKCSKSMFAATEHSNTTQVSCKCVLKVFYLESGHSLYMSNQMNHQLCATSGTLCHISAQQAVLHQGSQWVENTGSIQSTLHQGSTNQAAVVVDCKVTSPKRLNAIC